MWSESSELLPGTAQGHLSCSWRRLLWESCGGEGRCQRPLGARSGQGGGPTGCWVPGAGAGPFVLPHQCERGKPRSLTATRGLRFSNRPEPGRKGTLHHLCLHKSRLCWGGTALSWGSPSDAGAHSSLQGQPSACILSPAPPPSLSQAMHLFV